MKSQNFDTEANGKEIALDHQMVDIENNTPDADFTKEYVYDPLHKKRNNFWCSSTFWVPCTKKVTKESKKPTIKSRKSYTEMLGAQDTKQGKPKNLISRPK